MNLHGDTGLLRRIRFFGDRDAANALVEKYYREIYAYTYRQTMEKQLAMDLTQETFISVLRSVGSYDAKKASFRTWLYRIASRRIADYFRSLAYRQRQVTDGLEDECVLPPPPEGDFATLLENRETVLLALQMISELDETTQQILRLKLFSEESFPQIAEIVGMPESTVKSRYHAAIKRIQKQMEGTA